MSRHFNKSSQYPGADWSTSLALINDIYKKYEYECVSYEEAAKIYNVSSTTKSFTAKISGAKQFGLIIINKSSIKISDIGYEYLDPLYSDRLKEIRYDCIKKPKLFSDLIDRYNFKELPSLDSLSDILMNEYHILEKVKKNVAKIFIDSLQECGFISNGFLVYDMDEYRDFYGITTKKENKDKRIEDKKSIFQITSQTTNRVVAKVEYSNEATKEDLISLRDILNIILKQQFKVDS